MASYVKAQIQAANAVDPYSGDDLLEYKPGQHCPVTLPSRGPKGGWKAGTREEWDKFFRYNRETGECGLRREQWRALKELHMRAYYARGTMMRDCTNVEDTIAMFRRNGLACAPWKERRHFWGLKNSVKAAAARRAQVLQGAVRERHDNALNRLAELLDQLPPEELSHQSSYDLEACKVALREAAGRDDFDMPSSLKELRALLPKLLGSVGVCPDCLVETLLIILEHAKGGPYPGRPRSRDCRICNDSGRAHTDVCIDAGHRVGKELTAEDHARVAGLAVAYARPGQAKRLAKSRLAKARRLAVAATVAADERAVAYVSTTRHGAAAAADDTLQARRQAAMEAEEVMQEERKKRRAAAAARRKDSPTFRAKMRVVVTATGERGVVQRTTCSGSWIHVERDDVPGTKAYHPCHLKIDTSRKPSARKPAAKKPSKKKARK